MRLAERLLVISQAGFDRSLVDHRPDPADFVVLEFVENMLAELNLPAIDRQAHEGGSGSAIEEQPGGNPVRVADKNLCLKPQIGNVGKVVHQHGAIARQAEWAAIVFDSVVDEGAEFTEGLAVEAVEIGEINVLKCRHGFLRVDGTCFSAEAGRSSHGSHCFVE